MAAVRNWSQTLTPEQRRRARAAIDEYEPNVAGMWAQGRWNGWSAYMFPTTRIPVYVEMRKRDPSYRIIYRKVVWDVRRENTYERN